MKDFAKSYEQKSWEFAVAEYERMRNWLHSKSDLLRRRAEETMRNLEKKYPQLLRG